ncbi:MAG: hypothetical protein ACREOO_06595 [bacterium]
MSLGANLTGEDRLGGDVQVINERADSLHIFTERNVSRRFSTQLEIEKKFSRAGALAFKNSVQSFARTIELPGYIFKGTQVGSFSELNYAVQNSNFDWILGLNLWTDRLDEHSPQVTKARDYHLTTLGTFVQNTWKASPQWIVETGLRSDYVQDYGFFFLTAASKSGCEDTECPGSTSKVPFYFRKPCYHHC